MKPLLGAAIVCLLGAHLPAFALDIKGVRLGTPISTVAQSYGDRWSCIDEEGDQRCRKTIDIHDRPVLQNETYATQRVAIAYTFRADKLVRIEVRGLDASTFDALLDVLTQKAGAPTKRDEPVQNGVGNTFTNTIATWKDGDDVLQFSRYGSRVTESELDLVSSAYRQGIEKREAGKAADDM